MSNVTRKVKQANVYTIAGLGNRPLLAFKEAEIEHLFLTLASTIVEHTFDGFYSKKEMPFKKEKDGNSLHYSTTKDAAKVNLKPSIERSDNSSTRTFIFDLTDVQASKAKSQFVLRFSVVGEAQFKLEELESLL